MAGPLLEKQLPPKVLADIKRMFERGEFLKTIAEKHHTTDATLSRMAKRMDWDHSRRLTRSERYRKARGLKL